MVVLLLTGQHSCGILTHRINGGAADGSSFLWNKVGLCPGGFCLWGVGALSTVTVCSGVAVVMGRSSGG